MKKISKRSQNKLKLQSFEWTDDAIEKCNAVGPDFYLKQAISESKDLEVLNTMEAKIDRVQKRKKENEERLERKVKLDLLTAPSHDRLKEHFPVKHDSFDNHVYSQNLAINLNGYFADFFSRVPSVFHELDVRFPLHIFSSSEYHERLHFLFQNIQYGACLLYQPLRGSDANATPIGTWYGCRVVSIEESSMVVDVEDSIVQEMLVVDRTQVALNNHDVHIYIRQILDCVQRRANCVGLMRYFSFVKSMPCNSRITSTLTEELAHKIHQKAGNTPRLLQIDPVVAQQELQLAKSEYEFVMNKLLLESTVLAIKNRSLLRSLQMQMPSIFRNEDIPLTHLKTSTLLEGKVYSTKKITAYHRTSSYLCSLAAIKSLHSVLRENKSVENYTIIKIHYTRPFTIEKFDRFIIEQLVTAGRVIKQEWPVKTGTSVMAAITKGQENSIYPDCIHYDIGLRNVFELENSHNPIKNFLERMNFMMCDVLFAIVDRSITEFVHTVEDLCSCEIDVRNIRDIRVVIPEESLYNRKCLPPLFTVAFRVAAEDKCLNLEELEQNKKEIATWMKSKEAENGEKCPVKVLLAVMGKSFEYSTSPAEFKESIVRAFKHIVSDFLDVPHVQKFVMEKIYFPTPRYIASISLESDLMKQALLQIETAIDNAIAPLSRYLTFFKKYENFVNIDNGAYIASRITVNRRDPDSNEMELPVTVNLGQVEALLEEHYSAMREIELSLPITPIECGLFLVEVVSIRNLLVEKHRVIISAILSDHCDRCRSISEYLDDEFKKINKNLSKRPENIEQLTDLEEYIASLGNTMGTLHNFIIEMMNYQNMLEKYKFKTDLDSGTQRWSVFGFPKKIASKCTEVQESNVAVKRRFKDDLMGEQAGFLKTVHELEQQVLGLENLVDLSDVVNIATTVKEVELRLVVAQAKVKLFNSRETLFEIDITDYEDLNRIQRNFEPYSNLWQTAKEWLELSTQWKKGRFVDLNAEEIEKNCDRFNVSINKAAKYFNKADMKHQSTIANKIKVQVAEFLPEVPMIVTLRNPGMRDRHWQKIAEQLQVDILPIDNFTTEQIISMNLKDSLELIQKIGESAAKEYQIEQALDKMEREWENMNLNIHNYRETGTGVLRGIDDINVVLDEQITMTQTIMFSAFKGPFEERIEEWNRKLCLVSDLLEVWVTVQRNWLYLQPIFESADINRQLPTEGKKFSTVDKGWRQTISAAKLKPKVLEFCDNQKLLDRFRESEILLDQVQKGLSDYLETKRSVFARFYFLSNDELLSILSESKDVKLVQPHLKKCFEGIDKVKFLGDLSIDRIISPEGEEIILSSKINPVDKNVEHWMLELEAMMRTSIRDVMERAIIDYTQTPRPKWMQKWAGMCVLNGSQMHWTKEMEELFVSQGKKGPETMFQRQVSQLADMTVLVRGKLSSAARVTVGALTVIDVHARDVIKKLVDEEVDTKDNFSWTSQLRYYWEGGDLTAQMVAAQRPYGYEYLGNTFRLVITPLTDKCYLTLMGALQMIFGGAPAGPAGTGKTETTKDLAKALAMQCVVFNCSDGLDYIAMGKFFKGLAACGAWACFDEFNRINIEVLSVIGQQIMSIQMAIRAKEPRIMFEGSDILVSDRFAVFITMNPGYAGRSALPDSLQALFRPVAMMVPDYALIGEIMFFAYGFELAKDCGAKMVTTFKLCSEQLSAQPHYDYGMRAVKTTITAAGNLKRDEPDADEMVLLLRALQDVNIPKFLEMDLPLFEGIIADLFPGKKRPELDYGALMRTMKEQIRKFGLQPVKFFITKVIQLYEMIVVRHGLMLVGPTGGGKSSNLHILEETLGSLKDQGVHGFAYEKVKIFQLNPKSITMGQMYGEVDSNTMEWKDGIMSTMYRSATVDTPDRKWIMFDGPVDAIWIENMNTVLDDNKKLCLNSGEIIKMSNEMTMMFEVEDLVVASPATVSRVGIIYMEPKSLGLDVLLQSWLETLPECVPQLVKSKITYYFDLYVQPCIYFLRTYLKELAPTVDNNLTQSLMRILDCYFEPFLIVEGRSAPTDLMIADLVTCIDPLFIFALVWSIGATTNEDGRKMFDAFLKQELTANKFPWPFPKGGIIYDFIFIVETKKWTRWMDIIEKFEVDPKLSFSEIVVPTTDSVRNTYLLDLLLPNDKHVLMVGSTGTGKTININQYLMGATKVQGRTIRQNVIPLTLTFSANTSANMTQDLMDSKMDKRRKGVYGPAAGKKFYVYVDDLNMPKREEYGAQPPIELLRQWFDQGGWYDRKDLTFRKLIDLTFVASMGPPGGGRQDITARFLRHFNIIGYVEMSDASKSVIFGLILKSFLSSFEGSLVHMTDDIVASSIEVFTTIARDLLPTPSKSHYTFNLRDLAKVFQGMLMVDQKRITGKDQLARLWVHENLRVFGDRLTNEEDHKWLREELKSKIENKFGMNWDIVVPRERLIYGDFITGGDIRIYDEIDSIENLKHVVEEYLSNHNAESKQPMPLVMFSDALEHVARIARVLRQPQGNALLLGVGGSGRQSMTKLATYIMGYQLSNVEIVKGYSMNDWREDVKRILMLAGVKDKQTTFLFSDVQIINERMVEDINNILNSGDVPNLYAPEDLEAIASVCRVECQKKKLPPTKLNIFAQYLIRVRRNIHLCVCMSPLGEAFRNRLRNFPSLVNCCTIDWFTNWPAEALQSVGLSILRTSDLGLGIYEQHAVSMFKQIHLSVEKMSVSYYDMLRRRNYVTPTSYLELLSSFGKLIGIKRNEISTKKDRLQIGLDKLSETKKLVGVMQEELVILQPQLVRTQAEVSAMMVEITRDKASAAETKAKVEVEEANANAKAADAKAIADDAQRDLAEALPALEEAVACLKELKKEHIDEVKSLRTPPAGVVLTMKVCCLYFEVKPVKKNDPNKPGAKIDDYWEAALKNLLTDAKVFINSLMTFDKDNIPDRVVRGVAPFMDDPSFTPAAIEKASVACKAMCMWARAMYKYHFVALGVAPKRARLKQAEDELAVVMEKLAQAKAILKEVNDRIDALEKAYNEAVGKKDMLEKKEASCKVQLHNADKLIGGLGGEEKRWKETVDVLIESYNNVLGDVIISAATISYLGPFTTEFRNTLVTSWQEELVTNGIPHTNGCNLEMTLANPVKVRSWQLCSLPSDSLSTQNALIMDNGRRWPLLIDPQGQANQYIRSMAKDSNFATNGMDIVKLSDKNFLRTLENGVQFGRWVLLENIQETLDAALEPILLQQKFKQGGQEMMKLGDNVIPYNDTFRFFMTTKLANPHYAPEVQVKVSLLNFTITLSGLEEQLLGVVVAEELPELAQQKANLVVQNAAMNKQLYDIESEILFLLSNSKGNILDDTVLIETLAQSKKTSEEIKEKMRESSSIEQEIQVQSELYRPVAKRASLLYFVVADLGEVDPMYQYSLQWFTKLFIRGIGGAKPSNVMDERIVNLNDFFTFSIYNNVCRSLFERHKLLFSFILCIKILQGENSVDPIQYRFLLSGIAPNAAQAKMPHSNWLEINVWNDLLALAGINEFKGILESFYKHLGAWQAIFDSTEPHRMTLPAPFEEVKPLERLCLLRCLRRDKMELAMQDFITLFLGDKFIQPPPFDLRGCYNDSTPVMPLIFVLSSGSDPNKELDILANDMNMSDRLRRIALGQGQGKKAAAMVERGIVAGEWVMLQNCHLSISWMPTLEQICENMEPEKIHSDFRLWLTSMPSEHFPTSVLQNGVKITKEPPKGLRANLKSTYLKLDNDKLKRTNKPAEYQKLLFGLSFYHALVIERKKFGPLGWNIPYEFNDTDMDITAAQLELYVNTYMDIPYKVLQQLASVVNYGGRITDDKDMRTSDILIADFFTPKILQMDYCFSQSGLYYSFTPDRDAPHQSYLDYIDGLPLNAEPEVFGMHDNASITCAITEADATFGIILTLQPRVTGGGGISREDQIIDIARMMAAQLPQLYDIDAIGLLYPTDYLESMNTVLVQEAQRYNRLLNAMHVSLVALQRALKGLVVLSAELEAMGNAVFDQRVPVSWTGAAYPSLKPLTPWFNDLLLRLNFVTNWVELGIPAVFWISGFFFPQGFLTAILQNYARKYRFPIDTVSFSFVMRDEAYEDIKHKADDGCYIYGLFLEGARWDRKIKSLIDPKPKELFSPMPTMHMLPQQHRVTPQSGIYRCPVYKILTRTGTLSTTGHSTNFVTWIEIPSNKVTIFRSSLVSETNAQVRFCDQDYWIKAGVACFCALRY